MIGFVSILVALGFCYFIYTWIRDRKYNMSQPRVASEALVVGKRTENSMHTDTNNVHQYTTYHYATFEFSTGDRKEFPLKGSEYGLLREGDKGMLTFQGNKYVGFERKVAS